MKRQTTETHATKRDDEMCVEFHGENFIMTKQLLKNNGWNITLWIQVPPEKVLDPPNCTLSAFLDVWEIIFLSKWSDVEVPTVNFPGC